MGIETEGPNRRMKSNVLGLTKKCSFVGAGLAPALTEPQDLIINFESNKETKPFRFDQGGASPAPTNERFFVSPIFDRYFFSQLFEDMILEYQQPYTAVISRLYLLRYWIGDRPVIFLKVVRKAFVSV